MVSHLKTIRTPIRCDKAAVINFDVFPEMEGHQTKRLNSHGVYSERD